MTTITDEPGRVYSTEDFLSYTAKNEKVCPRCNRNLPLGDENWYRHKKRQVDIDLGNGVWQRHFFIMAQTYCKECMKDRTSENRRVREMFAGLSVTEKLAKGIRVRDECPACKGTAMLQLLNGKPVCAECAKYLSQNNWDRAAIIRLWADVLAEIVEEDQLAKAWNVDRKRKVHARNSLSPKGRSHTYCIMTEERLRKLVAWLGDQAA